MTTVTDIEELTANHVYQPQSGPAFLYLGPRFGGHQVIYADNPLGERVATHDLEHQIRRGYLSDITTPDQLADPIDTRLRFMADDKGMATVSVKIPGHLLARYVTGIPQFSAVDQERIDSAIVAAAQEVTR